MNAVNIPLMALFGLAYGLGHPSLASWRPNSVDKTLSSFHNDVNRTAGDLREGAKTLLLARSEFNSASAALPAGQSLSPTTFVIVPQKLAKASPQASATPAPRQRESLREPPRDMRATFSAPPVR